jgi:beta-mannosidase
VTSQLGISFREMGDERTVGAAMQALGMLSFDAPPDLDGRDWWLRCTFSAAVADVMIFEGLATIVDVWLNGTWLGRSDNMFVVYEADVSALLRSENQLVLCARAMTTRLAPRRPRARWRSHFLASQEWRWHRTTQMGRMPGFGPGVPLVGPWRPIRFEQRAVMDVRELEVVASYAGGNASLAVDALMAMDGVPTGAALVCGDVRTPISVTRDVGGWRAHGVCESTELAGWWPHTHG